MTQTSLTSFFGSLLRDRTIPTAQSIAYLKQLARGDFGPVIGSLRDSGHTELADNLHQRFVSVLAKTDAGGALAEVKKLPANQQESATRSL